MTLLDLAVKIGVDDQASSKVGEIGQKLGDGLKAAAKVGIAAVTAASAAIVSLAKQSIDAYAEYEQLVGGVDTLFKNSSKKVQQYAANAYKTAGMSANEYMSTVTSFSASLLQSLEDDTEAAAEYADLAITDMADNANKMGTSMEMIQNAYQGFAKQNYTMLDNLKLGYGGTKTEMERLIEDSNRVKAANGEMADLSIDSFADVVESINIMQTEMGITGTTAKEASETISGSTASMKAAWENLKIGIADENADIDELIDDFVTSAGTAANNILDRVFVTVEGIKDLFTDPEQRNKFIQLGKDLLGQISEGMKSILGIEDDENTTTPQGTAIAAVKKIAGKIREKAPEILESGKKLLDALVKGFTDDEYAEANFEYITGWLSGKLYEVAKDATAFLWEWTKKGGLVGIVSKNLFTENEDFMRGLVQGSETLQNSEDYSWYIANDIREGPAAGKTTTESDERTHPRYNTTNVTINFANPNFDPREIGEAVQQGLDEWEAAND